MKRISWMTMFLWCMCIVACTPGKTERESVSSAAVQAYEYVTTARLTVAESKRLIAKGLAANKDVKACLEKGMLIVTLGTTNTYIAEELAGIRAERGSFVTGHIIPKGKESFREKVKRMPELVLVNGKPADMTYVEALEAMKPEDIVLKGANMLNYTKKQAAVCVGAPDGGTVARLRKYTDWGRGRWIVPVGLEKETTQDLFEVNELLQKAASKGKGTVKLNVTQGNVYTEIEALKEFADVEVRVTAKGGVMGAEGGVSLLIFGKKGEVEKAEKALETVYGEPPFIADGN